MQDPKFVRKFKARVEKVEKEIGSCDKNDHYIPQFILRNFAVDEDKKKILEYKRGAALPQEVDIENTACKKGYYDTINKFSKQENNLVDRLTQLIESDSAEVIKKLVSSDQVNLSNGQANNISAFVANLYTRTPSFREQMKLFILYLLENKLVEKKELNDDKVLEEIFYKNSLGIKIETLRKFKPKKKMEFKREDIIIVLANFISAKFSEDLFYRNLNVLESSSDDFILNDNPVFISDLKKYPRWPQGWYLKDEDSVFLPISPNRCLVFDKKEFANKRIRANSRLVAFINFNIIAGAEECVYSHKKDIAIQEGLNTTTIMRERAFPSLFMRKFRKICLSLKGWYDVAKNLIKSTEKN